MKLSFRNLLRKKPTGDREIERLKARITKLERKNKQLQRKHSFFRRLKLGFMKWSVIGFFGMIGLFGVKFFLTDYLPNKAVSAVNDFTDHATNEFGQLTKKISGISIDADSVEQTVEEIGNFLTKVRDNITGYKERK